MSQAGRPVQLYPETLATKRVSDLDRTIVQFLGAHPRSVPERKTLYNIGIGMARDTTITLYELPFGGRACRIAQATIPGATMHHDFLVTRNHIVITVPSFRIDMLPLLTCLKAIADCARWPRISAPSSS